MGKLIRCTCKDCLKVLKPENAATNFKNPSLAVRIAIEKGIIKEKTRILEFGGGNLRNSLYILKVLPEVEIFCFELDATIKRFSENYNRFKKLGGKITGDAFGKRKYNVVICTFVIETICPEANRVAVLKSLRLCLKQSGVLIASIRGYPGVRGIKYKRCAMGEGFVTPLNTFVKPYSIKELKKLLMDSGFATFSTLQKHRVERPENIHFISFRNERYGKSLA